ncbi:hypothetical protein Ddye_011028 [Dipteronia dyeriana]|uniref:Uncharacterized protein n=1 Tax=Dipteronia dyeriana TaxID=168575 RepID=A0AAD9XED7_9ROSI|nr:hypothetical protein Ddye_011028 [Dipteronia dyeriana]
MLVPRSAQLVTSGHYRVSIRDRFGKFYQVLEPGCHFLPWLLGKQIAGNLSLRISSTLWHRSSTVPWPKRPAYVFDVIRAFVPKLNLDDVFEQKNDIAKAVEEELEKAMSAYGFGIV